jgi:hypothetical protein
MPLSHNVAGIAKAVTLHFNSILPRLGAVPGRCRNVRGNGRVHRSTDCNKYRGLSCIPTKTVQLARYAMMSVGQILLLAAAVMASVPAVQCPYGLGPGRVTRFVCAHCTSTGKLSSHGLFLNRAAVRRHIAASKPCHAAQDGIRQIQMEARSGDIMAGAGGAAGAAPDVRLQPEGDVLPQTSI